MACLMSGVGGSPANAQPQCSVTSANTVTTQFCTAVAGSFVIAAAATSVVVDTSAVTANSQILLQEDRSLGTKLGVTCDTTSVLTIGVPVVTARTAATSFTVATVAGSYTNPVCVSYLIVN